MWVVLQPHQSHLRSQPSGADSSARSDSGFTIVELLIVIVVIGVLAGITIVAYNGVQNRAKAASAQSAASQAAKKVMAYSVENSDTYPATLADAGISSSGETSYQYSVNNAASPKTFCVTATIQSVSYWASSTNSAPTSGSYQITNLVRNPSFEADLVGWTENAGRPIVRSTSWAASGDASLQGTNNLAMPAALYIKANQPMHAVSPGTTLTASATFSPSNFGTGSTFGVRLDWYTSNGGSISYQESTGVVITQGSTARLSITATASNGAANAQAGPIVRNIPSGGTFYADAVMMTEGPTLFLYADGSSYAWLWNSTPNASSSTGPAL